jgi:ATP-binding protein involved in chromosome partitioning
MQLNENRVLDILKDIVHPATGKDLVEMDMVKDLKIGEGSLSFGLFFSVPNDPLKTSLKKACVKVLHDALGEDIEIMISIMQPVSQEPSRRKSILSEVKNIIAIASGKGGVGKSTIAVNLAVAFAHTGARVGLLDADIYGPSLPKMMRAEFENPAIGLVDGHNMMEPVERFGVKTMSIGYFVNPNESTIWRGPMASNAFLQLLRDANWGPLDYLFVDLPPGTSDIHLTLVQNVPVTGVVIVSTPQDVALADAVKGIQMFRTPAINVPILGIVENMAWFTPEELPDSRYYIFGKEGCLKLCQQFEIALLGQVPLVQSIREGSDSGEPAVLKKNQVSEAFKTLADQLVIQLLKRNTLLKPTQQVKVSKTKQDFPH